MTYRASRPCEHAAMTEEDDRAFWEALAALRKATDEVERQRPTERVGTELPQTFVDAITRQGECWDEYATVRDARLKRLRDGG